MIERGKLVASGKTKEVHSIKGRPGIVEIVNKDVLTKGDGKESIIVPGKGIIATDVTQNCYTYLNKSDSDYSNHFIERTGPNSFLANELEMLKIECVARRVVGPSSSYRKRNPDCAPGNFRFDDVVIEFFYKDDKEGDPIIHRLGNNRYALFPAGKPIQASVGKPFTNETLDYMWLGSLDLLFEELRGITSDTFINLEAGFHRLGAELEDLKIECGFDDEQCLRLGDVIDPDSFRLSFKGENLDKQAYRNQEIITPEFVEALGEKYRLAAELSSRL